MTETTNTKRYKDDDGWFLAIFDDSQGLYLAWTNDADEGTALGEVFDESDAELETATGAARAYCASVGIDTEPGVIYFPTMTRAREALKACNAALHAARANAPLPEWAQIALARGWTPPKVGA